jgi:hypothetical protein
MAQVVATDFLLKGGFRAAFYLEKSKESTNRNGTPLNHSTAEEADATFRVETAGPTGSKANLKLYFFNCRFGTTRAAATVRAENSPATKMPRNK